MPKSFLHKGLIPVGGGGVGRRLLKKFKREHDPVACARTRVRPLREVIAADAGLRVWIGSRLYVRDDEATLNALADAVGLNLPAAVKPPSAKSAAKKPLPKTAATTKPSRAKRTAPSSNTGAAVAA